MSVDLSQFHQVFIEESVEGLDVMESTLMDLDLKDVDDEMINTIFRSAHSIKGGSATFGFTAIAEFTHVLETLLDQVRSGKRNLSADDINLFLESVDCMRDMLATIDNGVSQFTEEALTLKFKFEELLNNDGLPKVENPSTEAEEGFLGEGSTGAELTMKTWLISFNPGESILKTGNDPARIFYALQDMGECSIALAEFSMPSLTELNPECLYLSWEITITTDQPQGIIREQFEWVEDDSKIKIVQVSNQRKGWVIEFIPNRSILKSGNEPLKLIEALTDLGEFESVIPDLSHIPSLKSLDSEDCFISWSIELLSDVEREQINEVFEWVEDEADIRIKPITKSPRKTSAEDVGSLTVSDTASSEASPALNRSSKSDGESRKLPQKNTESPLVKPKAQKTAGAESTSIRVGIDKVDNLINMVGELVITQSMLGQLGTDFDSSKIPKLIEGLSQLEQNTRELQESVMRIRMLPISFAFSRFPRMVRDLGQQLDKKITLEMLGDQTELDKTVMEKIGDPLVHLVRNAIDHGIETPEERLAAGKPESGTITLNAFHLSGNVVIEIEDDGKGLDCDVIVNKAVDKGLLTHSDAKVFTDDQIYDLIFQPGFSTAAVVSDVSGRGVGMDVVRRNVQALNGTVDITSVKGVGSKITIRLPLTLAILDGQLVQVGGEVFVFPLVSIVESIQCSSDMVSHIAGGCSVFKLRDDFIPIVRLDDIYACKNTGAENLDDALMVVVEYEREKIGIVVDELLAQQQVVIKSLEKNYKRIDGVSGATILGDGHVALIIDIPGVVKLAGVNDLEKVSNENSALDQSSELQVSEVMPRLQA